MIPGLRRKQKYFMLKSVIRLKFGLIPCCEAVNGFSNTPFPDVFQVARPRIQHGHQFQLAKKVAIQTVLCTQLLFSVTLFSAGVNILPIPSSFELQLSRLDFRTLSPPY